MFGGLQSAMDNNIEMKGRGKCKIMFWGSFGLVVKEGDLSRFKSTSCQLATEVL